ncbi:MAG: site-specific integrase [Candidatus Woesearchaeota archaeon]
MDDKIDIHHHERQYESTKEQLEKDTALIPENRQFILAYLRDSELGKTIKKGQKRKIGPGRNIRAAGILKLMDKEWFRKPYDKITVKEMEDYILNLERGQIKSDRKTAYSSESQMTIKKFIRKFWKWLKGQSKFYPDEVEWIDTSGKEAEIKAVPGLRVGIEKMVDLAPDFQKKALIMTLFDGGMRESECLNLRLKDVEKLEDSGAFVVRVRHSKTFPRNIGLPIATPLLSKWLEQHPDKSNSESPLWVTIKTAPNGSQKIIPMGKAYFYNNIKRIGQKALGISVTPHMIRHTSATYFAPRLDRATYCRRFGWSFASDMPDRYIDYAKLTEKKTVQVVKGEEMSELKKENKELKEAMSRMSEQNSTQRLRLEKLEKAVATFLQKAETA